MGELSSKAGNSVSEPRQLRQLRARGSRHNVGSDEHAFWMLPSTLANYTLLFDARGWSQLRRRGHSNRGKSVNRRNDGVFWLLPSTLANCVTLFGDAVHGQGRG